MSIESLEALAHRQFGVFSVAQARQDGISQALRSYHSRPGGRWKQVAPRVHWVRAIDWTWETALMRGVLWGGPDAVISHRSAAALCRFDGAEWPPPVDLTLRRKTRAPAGIVTHLRRELPTPHVTGPWRHTDPLTTLLDYASVVSDDQWEWALESAVRTKQVTIEQVARAGASGGFEGVGRVRRVLAARPAGAHPTGSIRETQFVQLARRAGVAPFERQYPVHHDGRVVAVLDLARPDLGVFVEIDGKWHDLPTSGPYDRHRQNRVVEILGWRPLRFDTADIVDRANYTARRLRRLIERAESGVWDRNLS